MADGQTRRLLAELGRYGKRIVDRGLVVGPGGNTSVRDGHTMWISPSGHALDEVDEASWVPVEIDSGQPLRTQHRPSSEVDLHLALYRRRSDVEAVVHTHPTTTIAVISAGFDTIPYMFPDHVAIVGSLPCLDYIVPCTPKLARAVDEALGQTTHAGLLLRNHGLITVGQTLREAYYRAEVVEEAAKTFWISRTIGTPRILTADEAQAILELDAELYRQRLLKVALAPTS